MILAIRTDKPEASIGLYAKTGDELRMTTWEAHRELSATILDRIQHLLAAEDATLRDIMGVLVFKGPGSFTGLRIGITVANTIAYSLGIPIVGSSGEAWLKNGIRSLAEGKNERIVLPAYGGTAHISAPRFITKVD